MGIKNKKGLALLDGFKIGILAGTMVITLGACADSSSAQKENTQKQTTQTTEKKNAKASDTNKAKESEQEDTEFNKKATKAYKDLLVELHDKQTLEGKKVEFDPATSDIEYNEFAITDINGDGKKDLILVYNTASEIGVFGKVYGYDEKTNSLKSKVVCGPNMHFYENGALRDELPKSENASEKVIWPFGLWKYDKTKDEYEKIAYVSARNSEEGELGSEDLEEFPTDIDADGNGIVYKISEDDENYHYLDDKGYNEWINSYLGSGKEKKIDYSKLTAENIK
ncbi:hypothetical protein SAMN04487761_12519 [Lachnospiraceae bacterium C7]|nr:hypothetical protein SAMN04487761_12519 [Lachnospiraceae bacterium C7]